MGAFLIGPDRTETDILFKQFTSKIQAMLMHAPVLFQLHAYVTAHDHSRAGIAKFNMGPKGQFPSPASQVDAMNEVLAKTTGPDSGFRAMSKAEFLSFFTGEPSVAYGGADFVPYVEGAVLEDTDLNGPVSMDMDIYITNGTETGVVTISVGDRGRFPSQSYLKGEYDQAIADLPSGFRVMTKSEFFQAIVAEATAGLAPPLAVPGSKEFEPLE